MCQDSDIILVKQVDWKGVRPIYKKLSDEFNVLLSAFDIVLNQTTKLYLDHLICCIDRVDNILDEMSMQQQRQNLSDSMIELINGDRELLPKEFCQPELETSLLNLRAIANKLNVKSAIVHAAHIIFTKTENKRHETNIESFITMVQAEGVATALLPLSIMGDESNKNFTDFFTKLCRLMGVADLIVDAKSDYRTKIIAFKPTFKIYVRLIRLTISEGLKLLLMIPHKFRFLQYCFRFLIIMIKH